MGTVRTRRHARSWRFSALIWGSCILGLHLGLCAADDQIVTASDQPAASEPAPQVALFPHHLWTGQICGGACVRPSGNPDLLGIGSVGFNGFFMDNFSVGGEFTGLYAPQRRHPDSIGPGMSFTFRGHFIQGDGWTVYADVGMGVLELDEPMPPGGSYFNFTVDTGAGATFRIAEQTDVMFGIRYYHVSNAGIFGVHRNPSFNGPHVYAGLLFKI